MFAFVTVSWPRTSPRRSAAVLWEQPGVTTVRPTPASSQAWVGLWLPHTSQGQCSGHKLHLHCTNKLLLFFPSWHLPPGQCRIKRSALLGRAMFLRKICSLGKSLSQVLEPFLHFVQGDEEGCCSKPCVEIHLQKYLLRAVMGEC